jgi:hypothetical protein
MTTTSACEAARARLPELLEGPLDATLASHLASCSGCAAEAEALRGIAQAAAGLSRRDVPEPPAAYWDTFLPRVRSRIADARAQEAHARGRSRRLIAAAALVIALAGITAWRMSPATDPEARLQAALERLPAAERWKVARLAARQVEVWDLAVTSEDLELPDPKGLLEALDAVDVRAGQADSWTNDWIHERLEPLSRDQAAALKAALIQDAS